MSNINEPLGQLGFDALLSDAEAENRAHRFERETGHLPDTIDDALPFYRELLSRHHNAVMAADVELARSIAEEAYSLARRLNGGEPGILAHDDAPGYVLTRQSAAPEGTVPLWGQEGQFVIQIGHMQVRIELDGLFGVCSPHCFWPGFSAHAVDWCAPFLSPTGFRSFLGSQASLQPNLLPDQFAGTVIAHYVNSELNGKLVNIAPRFREGRC